MVAEYINEAPGELQYPNYQSTRGPNVLTGSRISAGKFREERAVQRVRKARAWFANVSYGPSEAWAYAQKVVPQCRQRIVETRSAVQQWLEACNTLVTELWHRLVRESPDAAALYRWGQDRDRYSEIISIHRELRAELADAEANKVAAEDNWKRSRTEGLPADEQANRAAALEMAVVEVDRKKRLVESELRNLGPFIERGLRRRMGIKAEYVHAMYEAFLYKKEDEIIVTLEDAIRVLGDLLKDQVQLYVQPDDQEDTNKLLELLAASTSLKQAIAAIKEAQSALVKAEKDLITFPEADKKELFHHAPVPEDAAYIAYAASGNYMSGLYASW
jgi:hypothetical protein